jgi:hypothetical protein
MAKRKLSKEARGRIAAAQKARWAEWRKNGKPAITVAKRMRSKSGDDPTLVAIVRPTIDAIDKQIGVYQNKIKALQGLSKAMSHLQKL